MSDDSDISYLEPKEEKAWRKEEVKVIEKPIKKSKTTTGKCTCTRESRKLNCPVHKEK